MWEPDDIEYDKLAEYQAKKLNYIYGVIIMPHNLLRDRFELIAYRGGAGERPENTMAAFRHAASLSSDIIMDLDLQSAKDQTVVVIHDDTLDRTTSGSGPVSDYSVSELKKLDAGCHFLDASGEHSFRDKGITIPTLEEVLAELDDTRFIIDFRKNDPEQIKQVIAIVENTGAVDRVIMVSELDEAINTCRNLRPDWIYGAPTNETRMVIFGSQTPRSPILMFPESHEGVQILSPELIARLHGHGTKVWIYTIDEPDTLDRLKGQGVDGIFTNLPGVMLAL